MADFQPVGKDGWLSLGDIPSDCYRILLIRLNYPTSALGVATTFSIIVTQQEPSATIAKWFTGLFGDGVVYTGNMCEVTDNAGADSVVDIASGIALINDVETTVAAQSYTISTTDATYKIYLTRTGVISSTTGDIPANSIQLATVVIALNVVESVTDARTFIFHEFSSSHCMHFQDLLPADEDGIHAAIDGTGVAQDITDGITNPDYARNISITVTDITDTPTGNVTITGIVRGTSTTDVIAINAGGTAYGVKAFDTVTNINIPSTVSSDNTVTVGFSDKIGLLNPITSAADVYKKKVNNADATAELSGKVNVTYHTVDCATVVANEDMEIRYKSVLTI